jgi:hypothetical protein
MSRTIRFLVLSLAIAGLFGACNGAAAAPSVASLDDAAASADPAASPSPSAPTNARDAFLAYAQCMRDHGVDMPDPEVSDEGGGRFSVGFSAGGPGGNALDKNQMQAADDACRPLLANVVGDNGKPELSPEDEQKLLDFAQCMREHGIAMPDPNSNGMVLEGDGPKDSIDRDAFEAANEACKSLLPGRPGQDGPNLQVGPGTGTGGSDSGPSTTEQSQ